MSISKTTQLLGELVSRLTREYPDDYWDSTTREIIEEANTHLGWEKIVWNINSDASPDD